MTNDENPKTHRAEGASFFFPPNAGASDNAAGVGTRLLPLPSSVPSSCRAYLTSIGAN